MPRIVLRMAIFPDKFLKAFPMVIGRTPRSFRRHTSAVLQLIPDKWVEPRIRVRPSLLRENLRYDSQVRESNPEGGAEEDNKLLFLRPFFVGTPGVDLGRETVRQTGCKYALVSLPVLTRILTSPSLQTTIDTV